MVQKKTNYWDQIFANHAPEVEDASQNEENAPDFTSDSDTQEHELNVREIFFAEEGVAPNATTAEQEEIKPESLAEPEIESAPEKSQDEDLFFGWTQTTKSYSRLNFEGKEEPETLLESEPEIIAETNEEEVEEATEKVEECAEESVNVAAEVQNEAETTAEAPTNVPLLSEDGSLRITLNRYEHPAKGFGFGLLEDSVEEDEENVEEATEEAVIESAESDTQTVQEPEVLTAPAGLDSWGSLAFELGLPVTIPETIPEAEAPKVSIKAQKEEKNIKPAKEEKQGRGRRSEKIQQEPEPSLMIDLEDEDFVSPENVFAVPEKDVRPSRGSGRERGRKEERETVSNFGLKQVEIPTMDENVEEEAPRRRRRRAGTTSETTVNEKKSAAIGGIVAGVVASKMKDETEKSSRKPAKGRSEREETLDEEIPAPRSERSRRSRRNMVEEVPQDDFVMTDEADFLPQANQEEEEETSIPNGARSRRRRRSQHEKFEQAKSRPVAQNEEEDVEDAEEEITFQSPKRSRRDGRNRFQENLEDEKNPWTDVDEVDDDEEDEDEAPRARHSRRSGRVSGRNQFAENQDSDEDFDDEEEEHVFTEVVDDEEDEEDDEWETDFSQHDVPGWRYTIDFIVNSNLKARKREPSSLAGNIARMNKRGGKRK